MKLYSTNDYVVIIDGRQSLWCNRSNGQLVARECDDALKETWQPKLHGSCYGIVGKFRVLPESVFYILVITNRKFIAKFGDAKIYRIVEVVAVPLSHFHDLSDFRIETTETADQQPSRKTSDVKSTSDTDTTSSGAPIDGQQSTASNVNPSSESPSSITDRSESPVQSSNAAGGGATLKKHLSKIRTVTTGRVGLRSDERFERKVVEEVRRQFCSGFFYYSEGGAKNITESLATEGGVDNRFFWNKAMLDDLLSLPQSNASHWIRPIIQGYVEFFEMTVEDRRPAAYRPTASTKDESTGSNPSRTVHIGIISRRSVCRAGTRFHRRGVDRDGHAANYVETELVVSCPPNTCGYVITRGSVPLIWSQHGHQYKPPVALATDDELTSVDVKGDETTTQLAAFSRHLNQLLKMYNAVVAVDLLNATPDKHEYALHRSFREACRMFDNANLTYVEFDFHAQFRRDKTNYLEKLLSHLDGLLKHHNFFWADARGAVCYQRGVFRVNCLDCLDRTNVVQMNICKQALSLILQKIGILPPGDDLPDYVEQSLSAAWIGNGDAISMQYTGTAALKSNLIDAERSKFTGLVKDGVSSASRFYQNNFADAYRQAAVDAQLGNTVDLTLFSLPSTILGDDDLDRREKWLRKIIDIGKATVQNQQSNVEGVSNTKEMLWLGAWPLIDAHPTTVNKNNSNVSAYVLPDVLLLLTLTDLYILKLSGRLLVLLSETSSVNIVANFDYFDWLQRLPLLNVTSIQIGRESTLFGLQTATPRLRIYYQYNSESGWATKEQANLDDAHFHSFKSPNFRLSNSQILPSRVEGDFYENLHAVALFIQCPVISLRMQHKLDGKVDVIENARDGKSLPKIRALPHPDLVQLTPVAVPNNSSSSNNTTSSNKNNNRLTAGITMNSNNKTQMASENGETDSKNIRASPDIFRGLRRQLDSKLNFRTSNLFSNNTDNKNDGNSNNNNNNNNNTAKAESGRQGRMQNFLAPLSMFRIRSRSGDNNNNTRLNGSSSLTPQPTPPSSLRHSLSSVSSGDTASTIDENDMRRRSHDLTIASSRQNSSSQPNLQQFADDAKRLSVPGANNLVRNTSVILETSGDSELSETATVVPDGGIDKSPKLLLMAPSDDEEEEEEKAENKTRKGRPSEQTNLPTALEAVFGGQKLAATENQKTTTTMVNLSLI